jgi:cytochrome c oxidase subunit 2
MSMVVVAEDSASFADWRRSQIANAEPPVDAQHQMAAKLFTGGACAGCHTVRGTSAHGLVGPDLTHFGSRLTIAAGMLPNTIGNLEGWISNAQAIKPGAKMPALPQFSGEQLRALAEYLSSLK